MKKGGVTGAFALSAGLHLAAGWALWRVRPALPVTPLRVSLRAPIPREGSEAAAGEGTRVLSLQAGERGRAAEEARRPEEKHTRARSPGPPASERDALKSNGEAPGLDRRPANVQTEQGVGADAFEDAPPDGSLGQGLKGGVQRTDSSGSREPPDSQRLGGSSESVPVGAQRDGSSESSTEMPGALPPGSSREGGTGGDAKPRSVRGSRLNPAEEGDGREALFRALSRAARHCYPASAQRFRITGQVTVSFCVNAVGAAKEIVLEGTTGSGVLDRAARDCVVARASPLPVTSGCYRVPVRFDADSGS